jgi:hypothetical protein
MNIIQMLSDLRAQRQQLDEAILVLERLATSGGKRRGRPPKWMASVKTSGVPSLAGERRRKPFSVASRKKMAASQQRRWAAVKKATKAA